MKHMTHSDIFRASPPKRSTAGAEAKDLMRSPFDLPTGRLRVSGQEIPAHLINNPFRWNCCIIPSVTIELGNPLGDTNTVLAFNSFLKWSARTAPISALRKFICIGTEMAPSRLKSYLNLSKK